MALPLITQKITYNNVLKLLELDIPYPSYTELLKHPSSGYYNELVTIFENFILIDLVIIEVFTNFF
jgi:hypothetical protein